MVGSSTDNVLVNVSLVLVAGIMNGSFAVPMKFARQWAWENVWLAWSFIALVLFPLILTLSTIPRLGEIYSASGGATLGIVSVFGLGWGASQVLFGLGIHRVGVSVGFAIVVGLAAAVGALVPLVVFQAGHVLSAGGLQVIAGVTMIVCGVTLCAWAGKKKEEETDPARRSMGFRGKQVGILLCILAGIGGSMINLGLAFGAPILDQARQFKVPSVHQPNAVWLPLLLSGFLATSIYCFRLLQANKSWSRFVKPGIQSHWLLSLLMGILWLGSVEIYGIAAGRLSHWGTVIGWPVFLSSSIITANIWGLLTGEWTGTPSSARRLMLSGVTVLVASIFVLGWVARG